MVASLANWSIGDEKCIGLRSGDIHYLEKGAGEPLVLVPALCGGPGLVRPLFDLLSQRFHVFVPELQGESWEFCKQNFQFDDLANDLHEFMSALKLERPGLMGVSFGGAVVLEHCVRHPATASFIVVQGVGACYRYSLFNEIARTVLNRLPVPADSPIVNRLFRILCGDKQPSRSIFQFITEQSWTTDQVVMSQRLNVLRDFDISSRHHRIQAPIIAIVGENDPIVRVSDAQELCEGHTNRICCPIEDAGHLAFVTHAEAIEELIAELVRSPVFV